MLNNAIGLKKMVLVTGYTDLRKGIDGLVSIIKQEYEMDPFEKDVLFLFSGHQAGKIKCLLWEGDGFLLLIKRLETSAKFVWPRNRNEAMQLSQEQYEWLMKGLAVEPRIQPIQKHFLL